MRKPGAKGVVLAVVALFVSGCAVFKQPEISPGNRETAQARIDSLVARNEALTPYKGIGQMWFFGPEGTWSIRGAWVGAAPGRFRVEALALTGQSLAKLICGKKTCAFLYSENGCFEVAERDEKSLKPLTGVSLQVDDLVLLLGGGVPISPHDAAWIEPDPEEAGDVLVLRQRWGGIVEKIFFAPGGKRVTRIETFNLLGLRYRAEIARPLADQGNSLPSLLRIENGEAAGMQIDAERRWTETVLPADVFVPKLPEALRCD